MLNAQSSSARRKAFDHIPNEFRPKPAAAKRGIDIQLKEYVVSAVFTVLSDADHATCSIRDHDAPVVHGTPDLRLTPPVLHLKVRGFGPYQWGVVRSDVRLSERADGQHVRRVGDTKDPLSGRLSRSPTTRSTHRSSMAAWIWSGPRGEASGVRACRSCDMWRPADHQ